MSWFILFIAGLFEIVWAVGLKYSQGFTKLIPSLYTAIAMVISIIALSYSVRTIPLGTAYAIWTGIGAAGGIIAGIILFNEPYNFLRLFFLGLIIIGIIGLKFFSPN